MWVNSQEEDQVDDDDEEDNDDCDDDEDNMPDGRVDDVADADVYLWLYLLSSQLKWKAFHKCKNIKWKQYAEKITANDARVCVCVCVLYHIFSLSGLDEMIGTILMS